MNNSLLYVVHLCMRGNDSVIDDELFEGTAKAAEGHAAEFAFGLARDDNMHIEVHWQDGDSSSANSLRVNYPDDDELTCDGKLYATKCPLTCPLHALAYEIECDEHASHAHDLIHPVLGRGHSNLPEASHNVLVRFRSKNLHLHRLHYITSTNLGLCQSNMTWLTGKRGIQYHWLLDLFR